MGLPPEVSGSQCPNDGGDAVWQARSLLNWVLLGNIQFSDSCYSSARIAPDSSNATEPHLVKVYPNPNSGSFTVEYDVSCSSNAKFEVTDLTGKKLAVYSLQVHPGIIQVNLEGFANGVYLYKVICDEAVADSGKLIITR